MKVRKRHLILIGISIVIVFLGLAWLVYISKTPSPEFPDNPNWADHIFTFLDEWASAGAPAMTLLAVAAALGIGVASILQTRSVQKNEQKQRLLNEVIEWAVDATKWRVKETSGDMTDIIFAVMNILIEKRARNKYIYTIVTRFNKNLEQAVSNLIEALESKIELLTEWRSKPDEYQFVEQAEEYENQIKELAFRVIEEGTKIKTRDIGKEEDNMSKESETTASKEPTLKDIEEHLIRIEGHLKQQGDKTKRIADISAAMTAGLVLIVFSANFAGFVLIPSLALFLLITGLVVTAGAYLLRRRLD